MLSFPKLLSKGKLSQRRRSSSSLSLSQGALFLGEKLFSRGKISSEGLLSLRGEFSLGRRGISSLRGRALFSSSPWGELSLSRRSL